MINRRTVTLIFRSAFNLAVKRARQPVRNRTSTVSIRLRDDALPAAKWAAFVRRPRVNNQQAAAQLPRSTSSAPSTGPSSTQPRTLSLTTASSASPR